MRPSVFVMVLSLALLAAAAGADVPGLINYQGTLTNDSGVALDTTVSITFSIYSDSVGGTPVWTETQPAVVVSQGIFNILLGTVNAVSDTVFNHPARWLAVQVSGDPEMAPRQRIVSVGYAFKAAEADSADFVRQATNDGDWIISGSNMYSAVAGKVGIGTISPDEKLHVEGTIEVDQKIQANDSGGLELATDEGTTRLFISDAGYVGIGTPTTPTAPLTIETISGGDLQFSSTVYDADIKAPCPLLIWTTNNSSLSFITNNLYRMLINGAGNVGIGTTVPDEKLHVEGTIEVDQKIQANDSGGLELATDEGTTRLFISDAGNVGIGTTSPSYKLDVRGNRIQLREDATGDWINLRTDGGGLDFEFQGGPLYMQSTVAGENILLNPNSGNNVGIGLTTPNRSLYIAENVNDVAYPLKIDNYNGNWNVAVGMLFSAGGNGTPGGILDTDRGKGALVYEYTDSWNRGKFHFLQDLNTNVLNPDLDDAVVTITNDGRVGIGTTNPARDLHVVTMIRLEPRGTYPADAQEGDMCMVGHKLMVYDGTSWQACW